MRCRSQGGFKATFSLPKVPQPTLAAELNRPEPPFEMKKLADLIPDEIREEYLRVAAKA